MTISEFFSFLVVVCIAVFFGVIIVMIWADDFMFWWKVLVTDFIIGWVAYVTSKVIDKLTQ